MRVLWRAVGRGRRRRRRGCALCRTRLQGRFSARTLVTFGMAISVAGMVWLAQLDTGSGYFAGVLPGLVFIGVGFGAVSLDHATLGVEESESGVASALVNTAQQVGGAIGTAGSLVKGSSRVSGHWGGGDQSCAHRLRRVVGGWDLGLLARRWGEAQTRLKAI